MLTETWLNEINKTFYEIPGYSHVSLNRTAKKGGGVRIYYRDAYSASVINDISGEYETHESLICSISNGKWKLLITAIYRPPNLSITNFNQYLTDN